MNEFIYFLIGFVLIITFIKIILPNPMMIMLRPTIENYKDVTYVDDNGKLYKYELTKI